MKNMLDSQAIEIPCPHCQRKLSETIGKLKTNPVLRCRYCSNEVKVDATQMRTEIAKVEQSLAKLQRSLGRLGK